MINKLVKLIKRFYRLNLKEKLVLLKKLAFLLVLIIFIKTPIILLRDVFLDLIYEIFESLVISKIFYWAFELLYYLMVLFVIKQFLLENKKK